MHLFDPLGNHAYYASQGAIPGALIDVDDVDGFGPEIFTYTIPVPGTYRVTVNSFSINEIVTTASLSVQVGSVTFFSGSYTFTADDFNSSNGSPIGATAAAFWDAFSFEFGELSIVDVATEAASIFTTASGENTIRVTVGAPESIADASMMYEVKEVNEDFEVDTSSMFGRSTSFQATHRPLTSLTSPATPPLTYEIVAFTLVEDGARELESSPVRITQDVRSRIRQEYVDKRDLLPSFARPTPDRAQIIDGSQFVQGDGFFSFNELSDYGPGLALVSDSINIANATRRAWGHPLPSLPNGAIPVATIVCVLFREQFHQTGDAIDLNPSRSSSNWPDSVTGCLDPPGKAITTYAEAQAALTCPARQTLDDSSLFHANHLHLERDPDKREAE